jgi:hypothetical protein
LGGAFSFAAGRGTRRAIYQDRYRDEISERVVAARRALRNLAINAARREVARFSTDCESRSEIPTENPTERPHVGPRATPVPLQTKSPKRRRPGRSRN